MTVPAATEFLRSSRDSPGPRDWILDLYGSFVRELGGWIAVADLLALLETLGVAPASGRSALSRMKRRGELQAVTRGTVRGYSLTESAERWFAEGTPRILAPSASSDQDLWAIASFTVPEEGRSIRYRIRTRLSDLGFGQLSGGLMIAPAHIVDESINALDRAGLKEYVDFWQARHLGYRELEEIVASAWDLPAIAARYRAYLTLAAELNQSPEPESDAEGFVRYVVNTNAWRELPFLDPGIAPRYLPEDWPAAEAREVFANLAASLRSRAWRHVIQVTTPSQADS